MSDVQEQDTGGREPKDYWFEVALERGRALNEANENLKQQIEANRVIQESNAAQGQTIDQLRDVILRLAIAQSGVNVRAMDVRTQMMKVEVLITAEAARMFSVPESLGGRLATDEGGCPKGYWQFWGDVREKVREAVTKAVLDSEFGRNLKGNWKEIQE